MSLTDIDKKSGNRLSPSLNTGDTLPVGNVKAHDAEGGLAYRTEETQTTARVIKKDDRISVFDGSNDERVVIGRLPDGTYGIVVTKEGYDVSEAFS